MGAMKRLQGEIDSYCGRDKKARNEMIEELSQYIQGELRFDDLSNEAKYVFYSFEQSEKERG